MLVAAVRRTLRARDLLAGGETVVVGCSGGPDSAALLHVLSRLAPELDLRLHAVSVDHGLRPGGEDDVQTARTLAERLGVPFESRRVRVPSEGPSLQAKARRARYEALLGAAEGIGASRVAVGHTQDDQAETVLSRLLRGAGVSGLSGIAPRRADGVIRPLLDCARADVRAHVQRFGLPHRADPSNVDRRFERARLRQTVVPALHAEDEGLIRHLADLADESRQLRLWLGLQAQELLARAALPIEASAERRTERPAERRTERLTERTSSTAAGPAALDRAVLCAAASPVRAEALGRWVAQVTGQPARRAHLRALEELLRGRGEVLLPRNQVVRCTEGRLWVRQEPDHPRSRRERGIGIARECGQGLRPPARRGLRAATKASDH